MMAKKPNIIAKSVNDLLSNVYSSTYFTSPRLSKDIRNLSSSINKNIDRISDHNSETIGSPTISKLYTRLRNNSNMDSTGQDIVKNLEDGTEDALIMDSMLGSYLDNKYLRDFDREIDTICKYMPKLEEALDTRKDNVLSADHFSKDFINVRNKTNESQTVLFNDRIKELKEKYDLLTLIDEVYDNTAKYGEQFLYVVPYHKALNRLLRNKGNTSSTIGFVGARLENGQIIDKTSGDKVVLESSYIEEYSTEFKDANIFKDMEGIKLDIEICQSNMLETVIESMNVAHNKMETIHEASIKFDKTVPEDEVDDFDIGDNKDRTAKDGLISPKKNKNNDKVYIDKGFPGCVVKKLERSNVVPVYIEDISMGYYYIEFKDKQREFNFDQAIVNPMSNPTSVNSMAQNQVLNNEKKNYMLRFLSSQLSKYIDAKFINSNQDLRDEIYMILKHNDMFNSTNAKTMKITFIPPSDMIHFTFKKDPYTHRGISDLAKALLPAKMYCSLYITNTLGVLTRGQDKRVYYVKQNIDTNIHKVLMETINQIKKGNFNIRQIENINSMLNMTGRFNDYVIPRGPTGESPIDFEVMEGQNIDIKTELLDIFEEAAINSTDIPLELIQARRSMDYAIQYTMTNSKFIRKVYKRQGVMKKFLDRLITILYNVEYNEAVELDVTLPPPVFLNISNTSQMINNTKDYVNSIAEEELANEQDEIFKSIYKKDLLMYYLGSHIDISKHEQIKERARLKASVEAKNEE